MFEYLFEDGYHILGTQVRVVDDFYHRQHVIDVHGLLAHDHTHVLDGCGVCIHLLFSWLMGIL